jgi:hypothetical protein
VIVTVTLDRVYTHASWNATCFNPPSTSSPTQTVVQPGSASAFAYLADARQAAFHADGGPSWHMTVDIGQRNSSEEANLRIRVATNAPFPADGGEVDRVVATISRSSGLQI